MPIVKVDKKRRITLPKRVALQFHIRHGQSLVLKPSRDTIVIRRLGSTSKEAAESDSLTWLVRHPVKTRVTNMKKRLDQIEDAMW